MKLPQKFGRYLLTEKMGQGGMAEIFKAQYKGESGFAKNVVIKRLLPVWSDNPEFVTMLIDEAKALVNLNHPNIVQVFELGRAGPTFFISMELVEGIDLRKLFSKLLEQNRHLEPKFVFYVLAKILKALDHAHQKLQMVHRDISPQNILISWDGHVKVADFGIAKGLHRSHETTQAQIKGKYAYMSPEQSRGEKVDLRSDLYATGILMFELLENRRLFESTNDLALLEKVRESRLPSDALRRWPGALKAIVLTALQKDPAHRYPTAQAFFEAIRRFAQKEKWGTDAREFAKLLKELFRQEKTESEKVAAPAVFAQTVSFKKTISQKIFPRLVLFFAMTFFCSFVLGMRSVATVSAVSHVAQAAIPEPTGTIVIDATRKETRGTLWMDGKKLAEFVTPYHKRDIHLDADRHFEVELQSESGKKISEKFILKKTDPTWAKTFNSATPQPAILRVAAKPWGEVTIPNILQRRETPIVGLLISSGEYDIQVFYPPARQTVTQKIILAGGVETVCQADFTGAPKIVCR